MGLNLIDLYALSRRMQYHESVERGDITITADVPARVERAAADRDLKRDRGVCGGECWALGFPWGAWDWLGLEWVERNLSFIIIGACTVREGVRAVRSLMG